MEVLSGVLVEDPHFSSFEARLNGALVDEVQFPDVDSDPFARKAHLESLETEGLDTAQQTKLIDQIVLTGMPVSRLTRLAREENETGTEDWLGSMGMGHENYGHFTLYELLDRELPEKRLGTIVHELTHGVSPFVSENAYLYGGELERMEAAETVIDIAEQSLATKTWLNGYHARLAKNLKLKDGHPDKISKQDFYEETSAILVELRMSGNEAHLQQVQDAQHRGLDRRQGDGFFRRTPVPTKVDLISEHGLGMEFKGIDKMIARLIGVTDQTSLMRHIRQVKANFYRPKPLQKAVRRDPALAELVSSSFTLTTKGLDPAALIVADQLIKKVFMNEEDDNEDNDLLAS